MKTVKLIDITVTEVPYYGYDEVRYYERTAENVVPFKDGLIHCEDTIKHKVVPVTHVCQVGKEDVAVAYTEQFEEVCGIPIRLLKKTKEEYEALATEYMRKYPLLEIEKDTYFLELTHYKEASFFKRLKYLFTGEL